MEWYECPYCREDLAFDMAPCRDGHGCDCPDRICTSCGTAILVGPLLLPLAHLDTYKTPYRRVA